jgi:V8-like Glu-specific endopeptidase
VWDPQWTIADSLIVFDCDTATGMSGSPILMGRTLVGIATASMNLSEGKPFNLADNFNFGYALEPSLGRAIACVRAGGCKGFDVRELK